VFRIRIPLTLAGLLATLGPQAINFGISVGGGETMLIPGHMGSHNWEYVTRVR
jgi:hypothetical protein